MTDVCLPDCMMPDGGQCCAGYTKQRQRIEALEADVIRFVGQRDKALEFISANAHRIEALEAALRKITEMPGTFIDARPVARAALEPEQDK